MRSKIALRPSGKRTVKPSPSPSSPSEKKRRMSQFECTPCPNRPSQRLSLYQTRSHEKGNGPGKSFPVPEAFSLAHFFIGFRCKNSKRQGIYPCLYTSALKFIAVCLIVTIKAPNLEHYLKRCLFLIGNLF